MVRMEFSWGAFLVYVGALVFMTLGGFILLVESHHPAFLAPILMGLFFFYICWEIVVGDVEAAPPRSKQGR